MRKIKVIKIDDREFTIKELTVQQVWDLQNSTDGDEKGEFERIAAMCCPELTREVGMSLAPSELRLLWDMFKEVNADFLELAAFLGIDQVIMEVIKGELAKLRGYLIGGSTSLSDQATEVLPGDMVGDSL